MSRLTALIISCCAAALLSACGEVGSAGPSVAPASLVIPHIIVQDAPAEFIHVGEAKKTAQEGQPITVRARIGGRKEAINATRAVFMIADVNLPGCVECCDTPWDYCCTPRDDLRANTATVQVISENGRPMEVDLRTLDGLEPFAEVFITGTVGPRPSPDVLIINATAINVVRG